MLNSITALRKYCSTHFDLNRDIPVLDLGFPEFADEVDSLGDLSVELDTSGPWGHLNAL